MKTSISVTDTARNFSDIINRVTYRGERFVLYKGKKSVAELNPIKAGRPLSELAALLEKLPSLTAREAESFAGDLARYRAEQGRGDQVSDPWES